MTLKRRWQRRILYPQAAAITTVSEGQVQQMKELGFRHSRMYSIVNGVDAARFRPTEDKAAVRRKLGLVPEARWLGMVARFGPQKRHVDLIEAFERMAGEHPAVRLLMVGDGGPEKGKVLRRMEQSPLTDRMHWAGFQADPVPWYQAMDALVVSSSKEGMPNAVLEGMACGLPIMANEVCGVREIAVAREHGWIQDLGTLELLAEGLRQLARASSESLTSLGSACREHVQQQFSMEAVVQKYDQLFRSCGFLPGPH